MIEQIAAHIRGIAPTIMANGQMADPMNEWARAKKAVATKKAKTDSELEECSRLEFMGLLYLDEKGQPSWPGENVDAMLVTAAMASKRGKVARSGLQTSGIFPLIYDGPKDANNLWADERFRFYRMVRQQNRRIPRMRPRFIDWEMKFHVDFMPSVVNRREVLEWLEFAGMNVGLSDWRPKFGRFEVIEAK